MQSEKAQDGEGRETIYFFAKFFEKFDYREKFVAGNLYMKPLSYFSKLENKGEDGRGDPYEGISSLYQPQDISSIEFRYGQNDVLRIRSEDLDGPITTRLYSIQDVRLLCLCASHIAPFSTRVREEAEKYLEDLRVSDRCKAMGKYAVVVINAKAFIERFVSAVKRENYGCEGRLVSYYDPATFSGRVSSPIFAKRNEFAWQREYRLAIFSEAVKDDALVLDVGSLQDICLTIDAGEIDKAINISLK